jgi:hypothetical protein
VAPASGGVTAGSVISPGSNGVLQVVQILVPSGFGVRQRGQTMENALYILGILLL